MYEKKRDQWLNQQMKSLRNNEIIYVYGEHKKENLIKSLDELGISYTYDEHNTEPHEQNVYEFRRKL